MATVERRGNRLRLISHHLGRRCSTSLKTANAKEADIIAGSVQRTPDLPEQMVWAIPDGADLVTFVQSGGKPSEEPEPPPVRTFAELRDRYLHAHEIGAREANSLDTVKMHLRHLGKPLHLA